MKLVLGYVVICWLSVVDIFALIENIFELIMVSGYLDSTKVPRLACKLHIWIFYVSLSASLNLMVVISTDRFYATYFPFKYREQAGLSFASKLCWGAFIVALFTGSPFTALYDKDDTLICFGVADYLNERVVLLSVTAHRVFMVFIPGVVVIILNILVIIRIMARSKSKELATFIKIYLMRLII